MYPVTHLVANDTSRRASSVLRPALAVRRHRRHAASDAAVAEAVAIRPARPKDAGALAELAEVDGASAAAARLAQLAADPSEGTVLVADVDGHPVAALDVARNSAVADPFERTASLVELLRLRARQIAGVPPRGVLRLRTP
jgi:hypothetical protein